MNISELDNSIIRKSGSAAKTGHVRLVIAEGRGYDAQVVSTHRTSSGADRCRKEDQTLWMWDSYMGVQGGFRVCAA